MKGFFIIEQDNPYVETRFNMANNKIINLADPENNGDAVSKNYVITQLFKNTNSNQVMMIISLLI